MTDSKTSSWPVKSSTRHYLRFRGAVLEQPGKTKITLAQLFSASRGFLAAVRITSKNKLELQTYRTEFLTLATDYALGDEYYVEMSTVNGVLTVSATVNGKTTTQKLTGLSNGDCHWKAGAYIQNYARDIGVSNNDQVLVKMTDIDAF